MWFVVEQYLLIKFFISRCVHREKEEEKKMKNLHTNEKKLHNCIKKFIVLHFIKIHRVTHKDEQQISFLSRSHSLTLTFDRKYP